MPSATCSRCRHPDTLAALGYGDAWEQLALRWPLYVVADDDRRARKADWQRWRNRLAGRRPDAVVRAERKHATEADRIEAIRVSKRDHMRRVRAAKRAA